MQPQHTPAERPSQSDSLLDPEKAIADTPACTDSKYSLTHLFFPAALALGVNVVGDAFASGSYAPPKARNAGQNAKIELYHLGKRLVLKRLNPNDAKLTKKQQSEQQAQLSRLNTLIQQKHLKSVALGHLSALNARELQAVVLYLTTRYGVTTR